MSARIVSLLVFVAFCFAARSQNSAPIALANSAQQHFVCDSGYKPEECHAQMATLRSALQRYPARELEGWTWVLVRSQDWKAMKKHLGTDPNSPAFTYLAKRETFFEEALVTTVPVRSAELMLTWATSSDQLLQFAVTHELGHALCQEKDEYKADAYGGMMRAGKDFHCVARTARRAPAEAVALAR